MVAAGFHVTRECGMRVNAKQRVFDFVVRPGRTGEAAVGLGTYDFLVVELKHLGVHQTGG
jgi:hypothetical protein